MKPKTSTVGMYFVVHEKTHPDHLETLAVGLT
jgi:hypothetical protein